MLEEYFNEADTASVDFPKIDTDGDDLQVLRGCEQILRAGRVLGLAVGMQFHSFVEEADAPSPTSAAISEGTILLFDLEIHRYGRAALPARFTFEIPAQTVSGQVFWGNALYFRDLGDHDNEAECPFEPTRQVTKLACLFGIFGMPDCSAELLLTYEGFFDEGDRGIYLDLLGAGQAGENLSYAEVMQRFESDVRTRFRQPAHWSSHPAETPRRE